MTDVRTSTFEAGVIIRNEIYIYTREFKAWILIINLTIFRYLISGNFRDRKHGGLASGTKWER